jgi:glycosyltransferase involved in cell wall biosynthesis
LQSVARQDVDDLEVIVVNDGSPDESQRIIDAYCWVFDNFRCIVTENRGQSAARNTGLDQATGDYVIFLDSDDALPDGAYRTLLTAAERTNADICVGIAESFSTTRRWLNPQMRELQQAAISGAVLEDVPALVRDASPCNKLIRRSLIEEARLRFPEGIHIREDLHLVLQAFVAAKRITVIPSIIYDYRARDASQKQHQQTERIAAKVFEDLMWVHRELQEKLKGALSPRLLSELHGTFLGYFPYRLFPYLLQAEDESAETLQAVCEYLLEVPLESIETSESAADRLLLLLLRSGRTEAARHLSKLRSEGNFSQLPFLLGDFVKEPGVRTALEELGSPGNKRSQDVRARARRLQKKVLARGQEIIDDFDPPKVNHKVVAREARLVAARAQRRLRITRPSREIWLVGEREGTSAEDTGFAFFQHLLREHPEIDAYFVSKPNTLGLDSLRRDGKVLRYGSVECYEKLLRASVIAYSDNGRDLFHKWTRVAPLLRKDLVGCFLQHGVIGLHAMGEFYSKPTMQERRERCDLFVTSTEREKKLVVKHLGFTEEEVCVTGLARFDKLDRIAKPEREILFNPTWRPWLRHGTAGQLTRSEYYIAIQSLLTDVNLHRMLEERDYRLTFSIHHALGRFANSFVSPSPRIRIRKASDGGLQECLQHAALLITDFSSVAWDFAYLNRPVLLYHFDRERFYSNRGMMLIEPNTELPGRAVCSHAELLDALRETLDSNDRSNPAAADFAMGQDHCERIFEAIRATRVRQQSYGSSS